MWSAEKIVLVLVLVLVLVIGFSSFPGALLRELRNAEISIAA